MEGACAGAGGGQQRWGAAQVAGRNAGMAESGRAVGGPPRAGGPSPARAADCRLVWMLSIWMSLDVYKCLSIYF